jgi:hypothetical protein
MWQKLTSVRVALMHLCRIATAVASQLGVAAQLIARQKFDC